MRKYLKKKLQEEKLVDIVQKCKIALNKGYLSDSLWEQNQIEKVRRCRNFSWFCRGRKKAQQRYDKLCLLLENELPEIETLKDPMSKLSKLVPFLEEALEADGKRRSFDHTFNLQGNILEYYIVQLKEFLQKRFSKTLTEGKINTWITSLVNISPYQSYSYLELGDLLKLLALCPSLVVKNTEQISRYLVQKSKSEPLFAKMLQKCLGRYARGSVESLSEKLLSYTQYKGQEKIILKRLLAQKKKANKKKREVIKEIEGFLSSEEKVKFREIVKKITHLIFINEHEDPFRNNNMDGLADYFLRKNVVASLYQLGKIKTREPTDYPQRFLLREAKKVLRKKK